MARIKNLIPNRSLRFADDYEVYVDYGKGQPVKMKDNEATFIDVEKFLMGQYNQSNMVNSKKSDEIMEKNIVNGNKSSIKNSSVNESTTYNEQSLPYKLIRSSTYHEYNQENMTSQIHHKNYSTFTPYHSNRDSSSSSKPFQIGSKIIYDETWSSNKQYNARVAAFIDHIHEKFNIKTDEISNEHKSQRACTYQVSTVQTNHEQIYPRKLCLHIAVNGVSKSIQGQLPLLNLNINNGDFGDDAGMFVENRDFCFLGLADGAGGNRSLGINPIDFSRGILSACRNIFRRENSQPNQLSRLITSALQRVQACKIPGSSTICLLTLDKQKHILTSLNIGDSGFVIYRNNEIYYRSTCTMNFDGCGPRQLFALEGSFGLPCVINEKKIMEACSVDTIKIQKNDIIILSSDGLWDVLEADDLQKIIERNTNKDLQNLANDLLNQALDGYTVNNRDDILIIVCRVDEL